MLSPGLGLWETCRLGLRTGSKGGGRNLGSSPTGGVDAVGGVKLLINTCLGGQALPSREKWGCPAFPSPDTSLLAVIWVCGCIFPTGAPGSTETRKGEISGSGWPFLFLLSFFKLLVWMVSEIYHKRT